MRLHREFLNGLSAIAGAFLEYSAPSQSDVRHRSGRSLSPVDRGLTPLTCQRERTRRSGIRTSGTDAARNLPLDDQLGWLRVAAAWLGIANTYRNLRARAQFVD